MREIDMPGKYDASAVEAGRYDKWVQENRFKPSGNDMASNKKRPDHTITV